MYSFVHPIVTPGLIVRFHFQHFQSVHGHDIKLSDRTVKLWRVAGCGNHPALRDLMFAKGLILQKLQHRRSQCLGYTVDFIQKQDSLGLSGRFHRLIYRCNNLTHGIFRYIKLCTLIFFVTDKRKSQCTLSRVMRHRIRKRAQYPSPGQSAP